MEQMIMANPTQNGDDDPEIPTGPLGAGLYLVATPIGNLRDITLRALDILKNVDAIACEDTRVSGKLMSAYGIKKPLFPYHDHNANEQRPRVLQRIREGQRIALISDAGMPLISDPGYKLVRQCREEGLHVTSLPGANAPLMALQLSGLPTDSFVFLGFLAAKSKARCDTLNKWKHSPAPLILFESANRLQDTLIDMEKTLGNRPCTVLRELTKYYEDAWLGKVTDHIERVGRDGPPKGEIVIVIGGYEDNTASVDVETLLRQQMATLSLREAVQTVADMTGASRKEVYALALSLKP